MNPTATQRASPRLALLAALIVGAAVAGWSTEADPAVAARRANVSSTAQTCPVTRPQENGSHMQPGFNYGSDVLDVNLWPNGVLPAGPLPDGGIYAEIRADGSIVAKLGWWREAAGKLSIKGERLDARASPLRARIPDGYGDRGFSRRCSPFRPPAAGASSAASPARS